MRCDGGNIGRSTHAFRVNLVKSFPTPVIVCHSAFVSTWGARLCASVSSEVEGPLEAGMVGLDLVIRNVALVE